MTVHEYDYKPVFNRILAKGDSGTVGIELEMVFPDEDGLEEFLREFVRLPGYEKKYYLKGDGSLPEEVSVEVVFMPHHLARLETSVKEVVNLAQWCGVYPTHEDAGMHVHVARPSMSLGAEGAFLIFWNLLEQDALVKLAGRRDGEYNQQQALALRRPFAALLDEPGHYFRVDARRKETLEVRVFQGTVSTEVVMDRTRFVHAVWAYCKAHPFKPGYAASKDGTPAIWRKLYSLDTVAAWCGAQDKYRQLRLK
ncbi:hypothetical protein ACJU26_08930 [Acidithiobacillus sp. M4-SHS-6]|uniref:hypothetical protein n=1 Tax=Acidithiobacillus sp. M4-SHS-6 TaxID=3383024 RepID=UPI0039BE2E5B